MIDYEQGFWKPGCAVETRHVLSAATFKIVCGWMCAGRRVNISCGSSMPCGQTFLYPLQKMAGTKHYLGRPASYCGFLKRVARPAVGDGQRRRFVRIGYSEL